MATYTITDSNLASYSFVDFLDENNIGLEIRFRNSTLNILRYKGIITNNKAQFKNEMRFIFNDVYSKNIIISDDNNKLTIKSYNFSYRYSEKEEL
ncbi:hypothetical protein [Brachyspira innocens]|uniref:hypothetical protein n=1 Tax=Brachyspira innocens TaxID=13264 RepID=UPI00037952C9|nr:hypothetical protein [Brachyspira innocens]